MCDVQICRGFLFPRFGVAIIHVWTRANVCAHLSCLAMATPWPSNTFGQWPQSHVSSRLSTGHASRQREPSSTSTLTLTPNSNPKHPHYHHICAFTKSSDQTAIMAPTLYPRATLKKTIKAHAHRPLSKNVDILVRFLSRGRVLVLTVGVDLSELHAVYAGVSLNMNWRMQKGNWEVDSG